MTKITDEMRLAVADMFKFAHRTSCYPDAMQFEAEMFADNVLSAIAPAIRKAAMEEAVPVAWIRRWAVDKIDVMRLPKARRPVGWQFHAVTERQIFPDDVPLYAAIRTLADKEPQT